MNSSLRAPSRLITILAVLIALSHTATALGQPDVPEPARFSITPIDVSPGVFRRGTNLVPGEKLDLNDLGQVVGVRDFKGVLWQYGNYLSLNPPSGYSQCAALAINNLGHIVGQSANSGLGSSFVNGVRWINGPNPEFLPISDFSNCFDINDAGNILCRYTRYGTSLYIYADGTSQDASFAKDCYDEISAINQSTIGAGSLGTGASSTCAWYYATAQGQTLVNSHLFATFDSSDCYNCNRVGYHAYINEINDALVVVGHDPFPFIWDTVLDQVIDLGDSVPKDINNCGQVVGRSQNGSDFRAFLRDDEEITDLNSLVAPDSGWVLTTAFAINDLGQIAGVGIHNGVTKGFLLTPRLPRPVVAERVQVMPLEGGVRAVARIATQLAAPLPQVRVFFDENNDGELTPGTEIALPARYEAVYADGCDGRARILYFTPPPYSVEDWGPLPEGTSTRNVGVFITNGQFTRTLPAYLQYTDDVVAGVDSLRKTVEVYYEEFLRHDEGSQFNRMAPKGGAIAEVALSELLLRADAGAGAAGSALTNELEQFLPRLRDFINQSRIDEFDGAAFIRPITWGQTVHSVIREDDPPPSVLLTLGTGTLMFKKGRAFQPDGELIGGRFVLSNDLPENADAEHAIVEFNDDVAWEFDYSVESRGGVHIHNLRANWPGVGLRNVARRLSIPNIVAAGEGALGGNYKLDRHNLSHLYIHDSVNVGLPEDFELEWVMSATYRMNFDRTPHYGNFERPALVARQTFALTPSHDKFEPMHCMRSAHVFPRLTFSISPVRGFEQFGDEIPTVSAPVRVDHRLALNPQGETIRSHPVVPCGDDDDSCWVPGEQYVAGLFKDKDDMFGPIPMWVNMFECVEPPLEGKTNNFAPVQRERGFSTLRFDNIHLEPLHRQYSDWVPWLPCAPILEAPGSFDGTIHLHWRWGEELGVDFGDGDLLMMEPVWWMFLSTADAPLDPEPDFFSFLGERSACLLRKEKVLWVGCQRDLTRENQQYETLSTGFSYALGAPGYFICPIVDAILQLGGYSVLPLGFCGEALPGFFKNQLAYLMNLGLIMLDSTESSAVPPVERATLNGGDECPSCAAFDLSTISLDAEGPIQVEAHGNRATVTGHPTREAVVVMEGVFVSTTGRAIGAALGTWAQSVDITFDQLVLTIPDFRVAINDPVGPEQVEVVIRVGGSAMETFVKEVPVLAGGRFCETAIVLAPGYPFDGLSIRAVDTNKEVAFSGFHACSGPVLQGDFDFDGTIASADHYRFWACLFGPNEWVGFDCTRLDSNRDFHIDLYDFASLQNNWSAGPLSVAFELLADTSTERPDGSGKFTFLRNPILQNGAIAFRDGDFENIILYSTLGGALHRVADTSTPVPGAPRNLAYITSPAIGGTWIMFYGEDALLQSGIYRFQNGMGDVIADKNVFLPDSSDVFEYVCCVEADGASAVFSGYGGSTTSGIYLFSQERLSTVVESGMASPAGGVFAEIGFGSISELNVAFTAFTEPGDAAGLFLSRNGAIELVADSGTPIPLGAGTFEAFGTFHSVDGEDVAFLGFGAAEQVGVYRFDGTMIVRVADRATAIPNGQGTFTRFLYPSITVNEGRVVFVGYGENGQNGIYLHDGAVLRKIVDLTDCLEGEEIAALELFSPAFDGDEVVFRSTLQNGAVGIYIASLPAKRGP